jgi:hypothetical protein
MLTGAGGLYWMAEGMLNDMDEWTFGSECGDSQVLT